MGISMRPSAQPENMVVPPAQLLEHWQDSASRPGRSGQGFAEQQTSSRQYVVCKVFVACHVHVYRDDTIK